MVDAKRKDGQQPMIGSWRTRCMVSTRKTLTHLATLDVPVARHTIPPRKPADAGFPLANRWPPL